ncbi:zinc finger protein 91-like [Ochlerotatus camptorhynchus]|uniref:zinc finger protein 91-like n=1 Tax=Ochlerotatus camptorhynchus TaxID=644619 RepID=UPI0031D0C90E
MTETLEDCLTCQRKTENYLRITDETSVEDVEAILRRHFWFKVNEYEHRVLCTSCWEKIEDFHKFYCEVEQLWDREHLLEAVIKTEQLFDENEHQQQLFACELLKTEDVPMKQSFEIQSNEDSDDDVNCENLNDQDEIEGRISMDGLDAEVKNESGTSDDSEENSTVPIAERCRSTRRKSSTKFSSEPIRKKRHVNSQRKMNLERNELIATYVQLKCDACDHRSTTFSRLLLHYRKIHHIQGYVTCCERSFQKKSSLFEHVCKHESGSHDKDDSPFQCELCEPVRSFKDEEGLQLHKVVCHTIESEKKYKCDQCEKAFASEWQLSGHKNWHQNVESLNIYCDKCNKYFNSVRTLNTHMRAHHSETMVIFSTPATTVDCETKITADSNIPEPIITSTEHPPATTIPEYSSPTSRVVSAPPRKTLKTAGEIAEQDEIIRRFCTLICEKCEFVGKSYYQLEKHYKTEHDMRGYAVCCGRKFCKKRRLFEHCQRHINPDMFRCELCNKSFTESDGLEKHNKWVHTPDSEKPFKCEICDAAFYKDYLLRNHMKYHISMEQKIFNCKDCDKSFGTAVLLRAHQQNIHGAASSWVCDICAKGFVHKSLLENHRLSHSEEGAASLKKQCEHCKKWLKNKDTYMNHLKRCLAGGPVTCDICGKEAVNELALASHKRFNHEERPSFACSYCGKQFKRILRLKEHEANHRGEVLYSCPYCPRTCNSSSNMYTHKKVAHPELWAAKVADRFYKR